MKTRKAGRKEVRQKKEKEEWKNEQKVGTEIRRINKQTKGCEGKKRKKKYKERNKERITFSVSKSDTSWTEINQREKEKRQTHKDLKKELPVIQNCSYSTLII